MSFERAYSGAPWEKVVGYCRAVRAGDHIYVTGTVAVDDEGKPFAPGDGYAQARRCFELIERALWEEFLSRLAPRRRSLASPPSAVPRENGRAHRERFGEHPLATTMVEVKALIAPGPLIEIEADAVAPRGA